MMLYDNQTIGELYTADEFRSACIGDFLDEATSQDIYLHYLWRKPCTDRTLTTKDGVTYNLFETMFQNRLRIFASRYQQYLRNEAIDFDPLVTRYLERQTLTDSLERMTQAGSLTGTSGSTTTSEEHRVTDDLTTTDTRNTDHYTDDRDIGTTVDNDGTYSTGTKRVHAELPQTTDNYGSGMPSELNWAYLTNQDEESVSNSHHDTTTTDTTDNLAHDGNSTGHGTTNYDGDETTNGTVTVSANTGNQTTGSRDTTGNVNLKDRMTGRDGRPTPELLDLARRYIVRSNAFRWLCEQLNPLFYKLYEEGDELWPIISD